MRKNKEIGAVILAAGLSRRMGRPKLTLSWGSSTVIGTVIQTLLDGGLGKIVVVTGGACKEVEAAVKEFPVELVHNPIYEQGEMLSSVQTGLGVLVESQAALIVLGDQPQIKTETVKALIDIYYENKASLVIPSFHQRRGHPWFVGCELWGEILDLKPPYTLRDFLNQNSNRICYVTIENESVLQDLDTPAEYDRYHPSE